MSYFSHRPLSIDLSAEYCCATIEGPEAAAFLQAQLACDVMTISPHTARWTCWVDARGKVRALGHLAKISDDQWRFVAAKSFAPALKKLAMFVLRSKVTLGHSTEIWGCLGLPAAAESIQIDVHRSLRFSAPQTATVKETGLWQCVAALQGEAQFSAEICAEEIPQSLGLRSELGFSLTKGCYPGQEIISRVHYRGRPPRRLVTTLAKKAPEDALFTVPVEASGLTVAQSLRAVSA